MITNKDFTSKELVKTLSYCTAKCDRQVYADVIVNGRKYLKCGTLQAVTVVCDVYKIENNKTNMVEYWACFGISKQHPKDLQINKELAYETAKKSAEKISQKYNKHFSYYKCLFCDGYHVGKNKDNK